MIKIRNYFVNDQMSRKQKLDLAKSRDCLKMAQLIYDSSNEQTRSIQLD